MAHRVELTPRSRQDIASIYEYIAVDSQENAKRWQQRLYAKLDGLGEMPHACPLAREGRQIGCELRETFFGKYRIVLAVSDAENVVRVVTVRHGARGPLSSDDLDLLQ